MKRFILITIAFGILLTGGKGYGGGLEVRFGPRTGTPLPTAAAEDAPDYGRLPAIGAELTGNFGEKIATARGTEEAPNHAAANGWCLRHCGFVGVEYAASEPRRLESQAPLVIKFRASISGSSATAHLPDKHVLVYTHNGQGYVHDNIQTSVDAIKKMGAENGFTVDVTDDPRFFREPVLKHYNAIVFANTNNQAFTNNVERDAFKHYIESGGGFVGIHSASGSERDWPYFWSVLGGKFVYHPHQQVFAVHVTDSKFPATRNLPATFEWKDECYFLDHLNPDLHVLLETDPAKLDNPERAKHPGVGNGSSLPLSWYHHFDGGREYYLALGHNKADYSNPILYNQILGGILWTMGDER